MSLTAFIQILLLGLALGGIYALMAIGLSLTFGVMRILNLAHGAFMILAAYLAFWLFVRYRLDPLLSIPFMMGTLFAIGIILYRILFSRLAGRADYTHLTILLTFSLALILEGLMGYLWTGIYRAANPPYAARSYSFGPWYIPAGQLYAALTSLILLSILWLILYRTRFGRAVRATMQNRIAAQIVGVDVNGVSMITFGLGLALAGASGSLLSFLFPFFPSRHWQWIAILLALVVFGGLGSLPGTVMGAFTLAVISAYATTLAGPTWSSALFYLALFLTLLVRPQGLLGKGEAP
jgi:branched-chain amino acid transport system permease protein